MIPGNSKNPPPKKTPKNKTKILTEKENECETVYRLHKKKSLFFCYKKLVLVPIIIGMLGIVLMNLGNIWKDSKRIETIQTRTLKISKNI